MVRGESAAAESHPMGDDLFIFSSLPLCLSLLRVSVSPW